MEFSDIILISCFDLIGEKISPVVTFLPVLASYCLNGSAFGEGID
jgi:hypothetical protein